jgi:hypothetical protein
MQFPSLVWKTQFRWLCNEPDSTSAQLPGVRDKLAIDGEVFITRAISLRRFEPSGIVLGVLIDKLATVQSVTS